MSQESSGWKVPTHTPRITAPLIRMNYIVSFLYPYGWACAHVDTLPTKEGPSVAAVATFLHHSLTLPASNNSALLSPSIFSFSKHYPPGTQVLFGRRVSWEWCFIVLYITWFASHKYCWIHSQGQHSSLWWEKYLHILLIHSIEQDLIYCVNAA